MSDQQQQDFIQGKSGNCTNTFARVFLIFHCYFRGEFGKGGVGEIDNCEDVHLRPKAD
ncbi:hypothetical protein [Burkholderia plantarii]|uniref:hypothetical protein n=1 Tax=Burkholderia plantarii TaxID=41899 RepID=UPI0018DD405C|nr:hypothetical protein [Burkholderia plantarii]MBI0329755.1 hypothetical protein [Burkholderia plantarii]